jgi:hypothetical protein
MAMAMISLKMCFLRPPYIPMPLAAALGVEGGETVSWELLGRDELHLVRLEARPPGAKHTSERPQAVRAAIRKDT